MNDPAIKFLAKALCRQYYYGKMPLERQQVVNATINNNWEHWIGDAVRLKNRFVKLCK